MEETTESLQSQVEHTALGNKPVLMETFIVIEERMQDISLEMAESNHITKNGSSGFAFEIY